MDFDKNDPNPVVAIRSEFGATVIKLRTQIIATQPVVKAFNKARFAVAKAFAPANDYAFALAA